MRGADCYDASMSKSGSAIDGASPLIRSFLVHSRDSRGLAENSLWAYRRDLESVAAYLATGDKCLLDLEAEDVRGYRDAQAAEGCSGKTALRRFSTLRLFFQFLHERGKHAAKLIRQIKRPPPVATLPNVLTRDQVGRLLNSLGRTDPFDVRDAAILRLFYCGLSPSELCALMVENCNLAENCLRIGVNRVVPIRAEAGKALDTYIRECRPKFVKAPSALLFLSRTGKPLDRVSLWMLVTKRGANIAAEDIVSPRVLRQSFATHRLQDGADERGVQSIMGHDDIESTRVYKQRASFTG